MTYISAAGLNPTGGGQGTQQPAAVLRGAGAVGRADASPTTAGGALTGSQSITNVFTAVASMMQSIGGGIENDKLLKLLLATLIIMALLEQQQEQMQAAGEGGLAQLGRGAGGQGGAFSLFASSTSITIEQSTMVFGLGGANTYGAQSQVLHAPGTGLDVSA